MLRKRKDYGITLLLGWVLLAMPLLFAGCDDLFDIHPYDLNLKGDHDINAANIRRIQALCDGKDTIRFACISDTHGWYTDFKDEVDDINRRDSIDFVIHAGDLTETGTTMEYERARFYLSKLNKPFVAVIGNHDFLGTGAEGYDWMFGSRNFSFIVGGLKLVFLDTNAMEYDHVADVPDFYFMEHQAVTDTARFDRTIVVMHAAPYSDEFNNNVSKAFNYYLHLFPGLMFCVYGHDHRAVLSDIFGDGLLFYGVDCASHRNYRIFTITPAGYAQTQIDY